MLWFQYRALRHDQATRPWQLRWNSDRRLRTGRGETRQAVFMGLNDRKLNGWPCSCGPIGQPNSNPSGSSDPSDEKQGNWFWAIYMRQDWHVFGTI